MSITQPVFIVEVAFANNMLTPLASLTWTDITRYVQSFSTTTGRDHELSRPSPGTLTMRLTNLDARFNPFNTGSPYYGPFTDGSDSGVLGLVPMKRIRVRATWPAGGTTYPVWCGFIEAWPMVWPTEKVAYVDISATDATVVLNLLNLSSNQYSKQVVTDGALIYYRLGDAPGSQQVADSSGGSHTAFVNNSATGVNFGQQGAMINDLTTSCQFTGGGYIVAPTVAGFSTTTLSVEMWVQIPLQLDTTDGTSSFMFDSGDTGGRVVQFLLEHGIIAGAPDGSVDLVVAASGDRFTAPINDGKFHHLVATVTGIAGFTTNGAKLYLDGALVAQFNTGPSAAMSGSNQPYIGAASFQVIPTGPQKGFTLQEVAMYPTILTPTQIANHFKLGRGFLSQTTDARVGAVLDLVGWPTADRTLEAGSSTVQQPSTSQTLANTSALSHMYDVVDTEGGLLFQGPDGKIVFQSRTHRLITAGSVTSQLSLGEGHEPYELNGTQVGMDDQDVWTTVQGSQQGSGTQIVTDATAVARYGPRTFVMTSSLDVNAAAPGYAATYLLSRFKTPVMRMGAITVHPHDDATNLFPQVLGRVLQDRVTVTRTPPGGGTAFTADFYIEAIKHTVVQGDWHTVWALAPVDPVNYLILNDATLGKLNTAALYY